MKGRIVILIIAVILLAVAATAAGARSEVTDHERIAILETDVAGLKACNPTACSDKPGAAPDLALPPGMVSPAPVGQTVTDPAATGTTPPTVVTTVAPPVPPSPTQTQRPHCNQGLGNGPEGCDPGNSNNTNPSNDELPCNRGGKKCTP